MKKQITTWLSLSVIGVMAVILLLNYHLQVSEAESNFVKNSASTMDQMESIILENSYDLALLTADVKEEYILRAKMAAYFLEHVAVETTKDYLSLVELLDIDELHLFTAEGVIYAGSVPKYIGYSFDSGEQMAFFKPMLEDTSLVLCQDITPNTAESKSMIYAAVWRSDGSEIVQIGLEPARLIEAQSQNELSYIFSTMPVSNNMNLYAVDVATGIVLGSTEEPLVDRSASSIGLSLTDQNTQESNFYTEVNSIECICVFRQMGDVYIGVTQDKSVLESSVLSSMLTSALYVCIASVILIFIILAAIDYSVLKNINQLIQKVTKITGGNLDTKVDIDSSPEFMKLSEHVNSMVSSLLNTTARLSQVLNRVGVNMAIYEYKDDMNRVLSTSKIGDLFQLTSDEIDFLLADKVAFSKKLTAIQQQPVEDADHVYQLDDRFLKIESFNDSEGAYGVILDVTEEQLERCKLSYERDYDVLTGVYNRRAFMSNIQKLVKREEANKPAVVIALDTDNLKYINDTYGHSCGDDAIRECVRIMKEIDTPNKLVARMGGDEFMVVIYGAESREELLTHIAALENAAQRLYIHAGEDTLRVKMSAGYAFYVENQTEYSILEKQADEALYRAKRGGKARFMQY